MSLLRGPRTAWILLTRVPWPGDVSPLPAAAGWMPVVGAVLGGASAIPLLALRPLGLPVAAAAAVGTEVLLTGALHWDGFADCCDALVAGGDRERRLGVMRDPRLGSGGVLGLVLGMTAMLALLWRAGGTPAADAITLVAAAAALARWAVVVAAALLPPADPGRGIGRELAGRIRWPAVVGASLVAAAAALACGHPAAFAAAGLAGYGTAVYLSRPLGGANGDVFGATAIAAQLAALGAMTWR